MKKILEIITVAAIMLAGASAGAAAISNPAMWLGEGDYSMGFSGWAIRDQGLVEVHDGSSTEFSSNQFHAIIAYGLRDHTALDFRFGTSNLELERDDFDFGYGFSWGATLHQVLFEHKEHDLQVGVSLSYLDFGAKNVEAELETDKDISAGEKLIISSIVKVR